MLEILCDCCDQKCLPKYWKIQAATPDLHPPAADPAALGCYCSLECAQRVPVGSRRATEARLQFMADIGLIDTCFGVWQRLLDAYPEPVAVLSNEEVQTVYAEA